MLAKLTYSSFDQILYDYYEQPNGIDNAEFTKLLLKAGLEEADIWVLENIDISLLSRFRTGNRDVQGDIVSCYKKPDVRNHILPYFAENITSPDHIGRERAANLLREFTDLIFSDGDIAYDQKKAFEELARYETLDYFLSEVFLYAIKQKNKPQRKVNFPFNNLPYERNTFFTGRIEKIKELHDNFHNAIRMQTITGLGGFGKTQVALEYAHYFACEYEVIWWVGCESVADMIKSFTLFLRRKECMPETENAELIRESFLDWFDTHDNWLLIYDDILYVSETDNLVFQEYLPKNSEVGHILLTTRCSMPYRDEPLILVDVFDESCAVDFLRRRTKIDDEENAVILARRLGCFPLVLEQAGAYIVANKGVDYEEYLELLETCGLKVLDNKKRLVNYGLSITTTLLLSLDKIELESSKQMLFHCAHLSSDNIDIDFFIEGAEKGTIPSPLSADIADKLKRNKIIEELTQYSLCSYNGSSLSMHNFVQEIFRFYLEENSELYVMSNFRTLYEISRFEFNTPEAIALAPHMVETIGHFIGTLENADDESLGKLQAINSWLVCYTIFYDADGRILKMLNQPLKMIEKRLNRFRTKNIQKLINPQLLSNISSFGMLPAVKYILFLLQGDISEINKKDTEILLVWAAYWLLSLFEKASMMPDLKQLTLKILKAIADGDTETYKNDPVTQLIITLCTKTNPDLGLLLPELSAENK